MTSSYERQGSGGGASLARRGPPLASIESLLSFEAKSTPRSEFGNITGPGGQGESHKIIRSYDQVSKDQTKIFHQTIVNFSVAIAIEMNPKLN